MAIHPSFLQALAQFFKSHFQFFFKHISHAIKLHQSSDHRTLFPVLDDHSLGSGHCQTWQGWATGQPRVCLEIRTIYSRPWCFVILQSFVTWAPLRGLLETLMTSRLWQTYTSPTDDLSHLNGACLYLFSGVNVQCRPIPHQYPDQDQDPSYLSKSLTYFLSSSNWLCPSGSEVTHDWLTNL